MRIMNFLGRISQALSTRCERTRLCSEEERFFAAVDGMRSTLQMSDLLAASQKFKGEAEQLKEDLDKLNFPIN